MLPIFCIGGANIDRKLKLFDCLIPETSNPIVTTTSFGGVARNVAENLSHWTSNIHLQCVIGGDSDGQHLLSSMQQKNVRVDNCITLNQHSTSHYYAVIDTKGELQIAFADMEIYNAIPIDVFIKPWKNWPTNSIVFIDANLPTELIEYVLHYYAKEIMLCIDPVSVVKAKKIPARLDHVFLLKPNQAEAAALTNITISSIADCIKAGQQLLNRGVKNVIISLGKNGYVVVTETLQKHISALPVFPIEDVNGAGDAFVAGILYGLQQNYAILDACRWGASAASFTLQSHHTVLQNISLSQLKERLEFYASVF